MHKSLAPQGAAEHWFPLRPQVVGMLSCHVEWVVSNGQHGKEGTAGGPHVICFRILGVWSIHFHGGVVPVGTPRQLKGSSHNSKGTAPHNSGCCHVGSSVEKPHSLLSM